jgi:hypothetical protein
MVVNSLNVAGFVIFRRDGLRVMLSPEAGLIQFHDRVGPFQLCDTCIRVAQRFLTFMACAHIYVMYCISSQLYTGSVVLYLYKYDMRVRCTGVLQYSCREVLPGTVVPQYGVRV